MLIKFKKPDPRAGLVAQMDSSRGRAFIDAGAAEPVSEGVAALPVREACESTADKPATKKAKK